MLDTRHFPIARGCDVQIFRPGGQPLFGNTSWIKPRGFTFTFIFLGGSGGGGGGGRTGGTGTNRGGGSGGGSGAVTTLFFPTILLPDILIVDTDYGGAGGAANSNGTGGNVTGIYWPTKNTTLVSAGGGWGGQPGTTSGNAIGGTNGTNISVTGLFPGLGLPVSFSGLTGGTGGLATTTSAGTDSGTSQLFGAGAGGASSDVTNSNAAGGNAVSFFNADFFPSILGGPAGTNPGSAGYSFIPSNLLAGLSTGIPLFGTGGSGGGSNGASGQVGGAGGRGGICSGGGGGGGGVTGGAGGRGGDGIAIFMSF